MNPQFLVDGLLSGLLIGLGAIGVTLTYAILRFANFAHGTNAIAEAVVKATEENGAFSLIGGGDSASAINQAGYGDRVSYVSTGGGALLEYMEGKVLPGVAALQ